MDETQGSEVLAACFERAGLQVQRGYAFDERGVRVSLDGFDPVRRVGFEFITTEAGDRAEFTPAVVAELERRMAAGDLYLLLVDEADIPSEAVLVDAADAFLARLRDQRKIR